MTARQAAFFLRAFGDATRLRIVAALSRRPMGLGELAKALKCPIQRAFRHLRYLHSRRLVESKRAGNSVVYRLAKAQHRLHRLALGAVGSCLAEVDEVQQDSLRLGREAAGGSRAKGKRGGGGLTV